MAKKTISLSASGASAAVTLDADSVGVQVHGTADGQVTGLQVSHDGTNWTPLAEGVGVRASSGDWASAVSIPGGWQVRAFVSAGKTAVSGTVAIQ